MSAEVMLFDGDCSFCTSVARWAKRRLPSTVRVAPWQLEDLPSYGLTPADTTSALYWIDEEGRTHRGHVAAIRALGRMSPGWRALGSMIATAPIDRVAEAVYDVVARNRHRLPGGTPACRIAQRRPRSV
ncbi:MAG: thiol-disulfide oxidoreductase DCC family protein [Actinomycetota bacterium]